MAALMTGYVVDAKELPKEIRAEIHRMSTSATEHLFKHMTYDEAREVMRHGWPSHYFAHLQRIARKAKL